MIIGHDTNVHDNTFDLYTFQGYEPTCAIRSQQIILRDFGIQIPQDELTEYSKEKGWYTDAGTKVSAIGNLLDTCGVSVHCSEGNDVNDLIAELKLGHRVIVGVDARELYSEPGSEQWKFFHNLESPDHALIVAGIKIDTDTPGNNSVILTDPGKGDTYIEYPLDHFIGAWGDSHFYMMATDEAAPYQYNEGTQCMEYSNFATNFKIQDFPFHNEFSSIYEFEVFNGYEPLFGEDGIDWDEFYFDTDSFEINNYDKNLLGDSIATSSFDTDNSQEMEFLNDDFNNL